ncbi:flagellar hook-length control protein FliK [Musicola keenii]|uniref:flagellar hook-length control protein FliK n=1 Tax=Musicola keenii TaxID=2884250 RepID=UPI001CE34444|nr:flagellar hook-length control protein FliK [Musicola keenii]
MNLSIATALSNQNGVNQSDSTTSGSSSPVYGTTQPNTFSDMLSSQMASTQQSQNNQTTASTDNGQQAKTSQDESKPLEEHTASSQQSAQPQQTSSQTTAESKTTTEKAKSDATNTVENKNDAVDDASLENGETLLNASLNAMLQQSRAAHAKNTSVSKDSAVPNGQKADTSTDDDALDITDGGIVISTDSTAGTDAATSSSAIIAMLGSEIPQQLQKVVTGTGTTSTDAHSAAESTVALGSADGTEKSSLLLAQTRQLSTSKELGLSSDTGEVVDSAKTTAITGSSALTAGKGKNSKDTISDAKVSSTDSSRAQVQSADVTLTSVVTEHKQSAEANVSATTSSLNALNSTLSQTVGNSTTLSTTPTSSAASATINARLGSDEWQQAFSQQIVMFSRNNQQNVELKLHPQELGAIQVSMTLDDNQAQIHLASAHSQVRAALEAALPQLRTALSESGITLGQTSVGSESYSGSGWQQNSQGQSSSSSSQQYSSSVDAARDVLDVPASLQRVASSLNGVDTFA